MNVAVCQVYKSHKPAPSTQNLWLRGKVYWSNVRIAGRQVRVPLHRDRRIAAQKLLRLIDQRDTSRFGESRHGGRWEDFKARYLEHVSTSPKSTRMAHLRALKSMETARRLDFARDFTPIDLDSLRTAWKRSGRGLYVVNKDVKSVKAIMRKAEAWGIVAGQDWRSVKTDREPRGRLVFHTAEELRKLIDALTGRDKVIAMLGARAGLRPGEIWALEASDIDFDRNQIHVVSKPDHHVKTYENRAVPMTDDLRGFLSRLLRDKRRLVIGDNRPRSVESMCGMFNRAVRLAGFMGTAYTLRHTFGSHLAIAGRRLEEIRDLMGHDSVRTTEIYVHLLPNAGADAVKSLPRL